MNKPTSPLEFPQIFRHFLDTRDLLKVITVATCDGQGNPNSAPKLLVDVIAPNKIYYLDYPYNRSFCNLQENNRLSMSFIDERAFQGYRLSGICSQLTESAELSKARKAWEKRADRYVVDRIVERIKGYSSAREAEGSLPQDYVIMEFLAKEAAVVKPDRALLAKYHHDHPEA